MIKATYDNQDRLLTYGNTTYQYDNNGTLTAKIVHVDRDDHRFEQKSLGRWLTSFFGDHDRDRGDHDSDNHRDRDNHDRTLTTTYNYDVFGNLKSVNLPNGRLISYIVDGQNRRVGKLVNGQLVLQYVYQSQTELAAVLDGGGNVIEQFIYGSKENIPDYMIMDGKEYRIISNQVGTPLYVVDSTTGKVVERDTMDEFGHDEDFHGHTVLPFGFAGGLYDRDTGLVRFGARDYDPKTGRWVSKDPIGFGGGSANLYGYSINDPVNGADPSGLSRLYYDGSTGTLYVYPGGDNTVGPPQAFPAGNNTVHPNANPLTTNGYGPAPNGTYPVGPYVPKPGGPNGPYGSGIFPIHIPQRPGIGIHSGRANSGGPQHKTLGCIRTTQSGVNALINDPPTTITIAR